MSFPLIGNLTVKSSVESFIAAERIPHAIMIEGDEGTGRHTLAHFIAKAAVCEAEEKPCFQCRACHMADNVSHPDISTLIPEDGKKNITVSQIRALRAEAFVKPHMAQKRVFIIDGADRMNEQAQNALLKVLEEPPTGVIFILICLSRTSLLETIVSRCTTMALSAPEHAQALKYIGSISELDPSYIAQLLDEYACNIGKVLERMNGAEENATVSAAEKFIELLFSGNELDMLLLTQPFEKDRIAADEFFKALKVSVINALRRGYKQKSRSRVLTGLYNNIEKYEELLSTNINLSLLFSAAVCESKQLRN